MGEERPLCGAGGRRGHPFAHTQLLLRTHWAARSEPSANSGDRKTGAAKCPLAGETARSDGYVWGGENQRKAGKDQERLTGKGKNELKRDLKEMAANLAAKQTHRKETSERRETKERRWDGAGWPGEVAGCWGSLRHCTACQPSLAPSPFADLYHLNCSPLTEL